MTPVLEVNNIGKRYKIRHQFAYLSLRERLLDVLNPKNSKSEDFWALKGITFRLNQGESLGIIGRNGAGKSTLLKILSRITPPTTGKFVSRGRIASLLEVGTGFHHELSGRENIYFNGSLLGMKRREIDLKFEEIVEFSGVSKFLDTPLKHYSSGMQLRLAFSVAAFLDPEILIIDEVLAVGDAEFQKKCMGKMEKVSKSGRTILFVSHDTNAISNLCSKVLVVNDGQIRFEGPPLEAIAHYHNSTERRPFTASAAALTKPIYIKSIETRNGQANVQSQFLHSDEITLRFSIGINDYSVKCDLFVLILDNRKRRVFALESTTISTTMEVTIESNTLVRGSYSITAFLNKPNIARLDEITDVCDFEIIDNGSPMLKHGAFDYGTIFPRATWHYEHTEHGKR